MSDFNIKTVRLINAVDVATVPETFLTDTKFEMWLSPDPRFMFVKDKRPGSKHLPTVVPLSNISYMLIDQFPDRNKKADKVK